MKIVMPKKIEKFVNFVEIIVEKILHKIKAPVGFKLNCPEKYVWHLHRLK